MATHNKNSDAGAQHLGSKYIFGEITRFKTLRAGLANMLTSDAKAVVRSEQDKAQSNAGAPVTLIKDLTKDHGTDISVDIGHELSEPGIMGDNMVEGKEEPLSSASFTLAISQIRKPVSFGGAQARQRVGYSLLKVGNQAITNWWARNDSEIMMYHLAGARGQYSAVDTINPLDTPDSGLAEILVNPLTAPTFNRNFYAGGANSIDGTGVGGVAMQAGDQLSKDMVDDLSTRIQEMPHPPQAIDLSTEDKPMDTDPFYLFLVTPRQWDTFKSNSGNFLQLVADATRRAQGFNHHLFRGDCLMVENILMRKYYTPITFTPGSTVKVSNDDLKATEHDEVVPGTVGAAGSFDVDRGVLIGAQAIAIAYGAQKPGRTFNLVTQPYDGDNKTRGILEAMKGIAKVRFPDKNGRVEDYGVLTYNSAVPSRLAA